MENSYSTLLESKPSIYSYLAKKKNILNECLFLLRIDYGELGETRQSSHSSNIIKPAVFVWLSIHNFVRNDGQHNTCLYSKLSFKWPLWIKNSSLNTTSFTTTPQCGDMKIRAGFCDACVYIELNSCHANLFNTHKHLSYQTINFLRTYIIIA